MNSRYDYVYGSAAPELPQRSGREEQSIRRRRPVPKRVPEVETIAFPLMRIVVCILIGFAVFFTIISRFSTITEMNCDLSAYSEEYSTLKDDNRRLQAEIGARINLENVREIAENKLNMKMPDSYQRIPVKIPKVNYGIVNQEIEPKTKMTIKSLITACFGR